MERALICPSRAIFMSVVWSWDIRLELHNVRPQTSSTTVSSIPYIINHNAVINMLIFPFQTQLLSTTIKLTPKCKRILLEQYINKHRNQMNDWGENWYIIPKMPVNRASGSNNKIHTHTPNKQCLWHQRLAEGLLESLSPPCRQKSVVGMREQSAHTFE